MKSATFPALSREKSQKGLWEDSGCLELRVSGFENKSRAQSLGKNL